ncbi:rhomboid protease [Entamoeba marina]
MEVCCDDCADDAKCTKVKVFGVDGNTQEFMMHLPINYFKLNAYTCCPCIIPPICSTKNSDRCSSLMFSATFILSLVQIILLIVSIAIEGFEKVSINWMLGPTSNSIDLLGCKNAVKMVHEHQYWRYITPIFLHGGVIHLLFNIVIQLRLGLITERRWNTLRFVIVYFGSGIIGNCFSLIIQTHTLSVCASSSLLGILSGFFVDLMINMRKFQVNLWLNLMGRVMISVVILFAFSFSTNIDYSGNVFGFISGGILTFGLLCHQNKWIKKLWIVKLPIWIISGMICIGSVVTTILLLYLEIDV